MSGPVTVSGPGVDRKVREGAAVGLSGAITYANRATLSGDACSYYVRDASGTVVGRVDSDGYGGVQVYGPDRASDGAAAPPDGRPEPTRAKARPTREENPMAEKDLAADLKEEAAQKVSAKEAARRVLARAGEPMHADEIVKRVLRTKGVQLGGATPDATIKAMLSVENKKQDGLFVRTEKATYKLREQATA